MAEDAVFTVRVEEIAAGGAGLARHGGKPVFVEGSAPGELVACRLSEERRSWARAELLEITEASPERIEPRCGRYGLCGGCNLQHIRYEAQLAAKTAIFKTAFERIGGFSPPEPAVFPSQPWEYRNRMQFHRISGKMQDAAWRGGENGGAFGLKARKSGGVVPLADCPIADPGIREALRQSAEGGAAIIPPPGKDRFTVYARGGLFLSDGGKRRGQVTLLNRSLTLDAGLFFQSNGAMLERLIVDLRDIAAAGAGGLMADLYCGVGTFACFLADLFPRAELVEKNKSALALARENLAKTGAGAAAECFALSGDDWAARKTGAPCIFIVVDPPRQGLSPFLSAWLAVKGPPLLAYVSCDPATLARDGGILRRGGYELAELRLYDFYPQTAHIESLAVFRK
ncbi:MAG: class I SAM-dependent RNA methyltransferase [Treponema sp.]|jgi:23S rRNA (uracil1939-C5)-methyltransferase|nr:class I SAM-dependent RNA methyltransferase [Treponema sp.]